MSEWADFAAELAGAVTEQDVLAVLGEMIGPLAGAQLVNIALLDPDGHTMRLVEARGMRAEVASQLATYDLRILRPSTEALASGKVVLLRTPDDLDRRFPEVAGTPLDQTSLAVAPLGPRDRPLGVLSLGWVREQTFDPDQVQGIRQLATICGAAMERAQAHHRESGARLDAQRTAQRLADLYALTTRLAAATSATEVATTLIEVCLPMLSASAATITIYDGLRRPRLLAATGIPGVEDILFGGSDPEDLPGAEAYAQLSAVRQMVRDRRPVLVTSAADRRLRYPDMVADEGVQQAWANLPLVVGDRLGGIVAFGWDDPRWFDAEETSFLSTWPRTPRSRSTAPCRCRPPSRRWPGCAPCRRSPPGSPPPPPSRRSSASRNVSSRLLVRRKHVLPASVPPTTVDTLPVVPSVRAPTMLLVP